MKEQRVQSMSIDQGMAEEKRVEERYGKDRFAY
jgi:hypothetical protein